MEHIFQHMSQLLYALAIETEKEMSLRMFWQHAPLICISAMFSGWEGSAADSAIFDDARGKDFAVPKSKFYLGDAGFPCCDALLVPYRGVRYHLREWGVVRER